MGVMTRAIIYSCIAFSIVFIVLGGLTLVIYAMRILTGASSEPGPGTAPDGKDRAASKTEPAPSATGVKSRHVAAVTAAILAATHGRGRILSVTPIGQARTISSESTKIWKTAAVVTAVSRRLAPSWKR